ncbi:MAG: enoyl-CoA hydratase-related protein, partial [Geminicoccaceae bacterium]
DLAWLKEVAGFSVEGNVAFSRKTTEAMCSLNRFPVPTIALVHAACYGGGVGMVACCDVRIATETASFALTEVRWGVIPAPIIPQLCAAMGVTSLRRYGITGERFEASEARRIGLIHEVCADDGLDRAAAPIIEAILRSAPEAVRETKRLVLAQAGLALSEQEVEALAAQAAVKRASPEAAEGLASFEAKRDPCWYRPDGER